MKSIALLAIAFLVSCASSTDVLDHRALGCESGQDIDVMAGLEKGELSEYSTGDDRFELLVNVSNNSHEELTVTAIRAEQVRKESTLYHVDPVARRFDQLLPEGKDHTFHVPLIGRVGSFTDPRTRQRDQSGVVQLAVTVNLSNGDSYRCEFDVGSVR